MNEREYDSDTLTADQILALLDLTLESWGECEFDRLVNLPSEELLGRFRKRLEANKLGLEQAAHLLAMNGLTLRSWLKSSKPLPEASHHKLAGLCLVLSLAEDADGSEAGNLARTAVASVQSGATRTVPVRSDETTRTLAVVFGVAGLAAAALHSALTRTTAPSASGGEE